MIEDKSENPYALSNSAVEFVKVRTNWLPGFLVVLGFIFSLVATALMLFIACLCFVSTYWLAAFGWVYSYFIHAAILAVILGFCFVLAWRHERLNGRPLFLLYYKVGIGVVCAVAAILGWIIVGFAVLIRM